MNSKNFVNRRVFVSCGALALLPYASAAPVPLSQAINRSGKMRALSQRLSKAYVQRYVNVLPERAHDIQTASRQLISSSLAELGSASLSSDTRSLLQALDKDFQRLLETVGTRKDVLEVARAADVVMENADRLTEAFEMQSPQSSARIVNIAGRQRMLSQRAARAYFLMAAGHDTPAVRTQLTNARNEFNLGLATLQAASIPTPAIRYELELAKGQWLFYEGALSETVATTSERVFEVMDNLTSLYDTALRDLIG